MSDRDPRTDPRPGDWVAFGDVQIRVDHVGNGQVHYAHFQGDEPEARGLFRRDFDDWVRQAQKGHVLRAGRAHG